MLIKKACPFFIFQTKIHNRATKLCKILEKSKINKSRNRAQEGRQKKEKKRKNEKEEKTGKKRKFKKKQL